MREMKTKAILILTALLLISLTSGCINLGNVDFDDIEPVVRENSIMMEIFFEIKGADDVKFSLYNPNGDLQDSITNVNKDETLIYLNINYPESGYYKVEATINEEIIGTYKEKFDGPDLTIKDVNYEIVKNELHVKGIEYDNYGDMPTSYLKIKFTVNGTFKNLQFKSPQVVEVNHLYLNEFDPMIFDNIEIDNNYELKVEIYDTHAEIADRTIIEIST